MNSEESLGGVDADCADDIGHVASQCDRELYRVGNEHAAAGT